MKIQTQRTLKAMVGRAAIAPITAFTLANIAGIHQLSVVEYTSQLGSTGGGQTFFITDNATYIKPVSSYPVATPKLVDVSDLSWATSGTVWGHIALRG
jgi:hypothetical protein